MKHYLAIQNSSIYPEAHSQKKGKKIDTTFFTKISQEWSVAQLLVFLPSV